MIKDFGNRIAFDLFHYGKTKKLSLSDLEKIMKKLKRQKILRRPSHPGEILKNLWLDELEISQSEFAETLSKATKGKVKISTMQTKLSEVINGKRAMSADFAVLLSKVLDSTPQMWMNLQMNLDIWEAERDAA